MTSRKETRGIFRVLAGVLALGAAFGMAFAAKMATSGDQLAWGFFAASLLHYGEFLSIAVRGDGLLLSKMRRSAAVA